MPCTSCYTCQHSSECKDWLYTSQRAGLAELKHCPRHDRGASYTISVAASPGAGSVPCADEQQSRRNRADAASFHMLEVFGLLWPVVHM